MNHTAHLVSQSGFLLVLSEAHCRKIVALSFICADAGERRIKVCVWILPHVANTHRPPRPPRPPAPALAATSAWFHEQPARRLLQVTTLRQERDDVTLSRHAGTNKPTVKYNNFLKSCVPSGRLLSVCPSHFPLSQFLTGGN